MAVGGILGVRVGHGLCLALLVGIREQNQLAMIFGLHWTTMMLGLLTEAGSRPRLTTEGPAEEGARRFRYWRDDPLRDAYRVDESMEVLAARISDAPGLLHLWARAAHQLGSDGSRASCPSRWRTRRTRPRLVELRMYFRLRRWNYMRRMLPHVIGIFTYLFAWVIILNHFFQQLDDLRREDEELFERVPDFVPWAVLGSFVIFTTFTCCASHATARNGGLRSPLTVPFAD